MCTVAREFRGSVVSRARRVRAVGRRVCSACARHACGCGLYKVLSRRFEGVWECSRCGTSSGVTVRDVAHYNAGMDEQCGYRDVMPVALAATHECQFCGRVREEGLMDFAPGEGWECRNAVRCEMAQHGSEIDIGDVA